MPAQSFIRSLLAAVVASVLVALGVGAGIGSPLLVAGLAAAIATFVATRTAAPEPAPRPEVAPPPPPSPALADALDAFGDPLLLVEGRRVARANAAALSLFGRHIVGEDVRLAIRHPAAADRLIGGDDLAPGTRLPPVAIMGLGERESRWELGVTLLGGGIRVVRLTDRSETHAAEKMRVDFVANASHELRTPLSSLLGFIETLEEAGDDIETRGRFLRIMFREAKRMQQLVDDLMSLSRIEADKYRLPQTAVELPALAEEVRGAITSGLGTDRDRVTITVEEALPAVAGDRVQLSQLLHNLVGNAIKYGGGRPIEVALVRVRDTVRLTVTDHGDGIAPEHLPRLTERFYRIDASRSRAMGGTGLGLAIVKHIVERHRGRLDIESVCGAGTTVTVLLPVARSADAAEPRPVPALDVAAR